MINYVEGSTCPICGETEELICTQLTRIGAECKYTTCCKCGLVKRNPKLELNIASEIYKSGQYYNLNYPDKDIVRDYNKLANDRHYSDRGREKFISSYIHGNALSILEIGCGVGSFSGLLTQLGHQVIAIEPDFELAKYAEERYKIKVYPNIYEEVSAELQEYDMVVLLHVFEHMVDPIQFLKCIRKNISRKGVLFIEVPNILKLSTEFTQWYQGYDATHAYNYSENSLTNILNLAGYKVILKQVSNVLRFVCCVDSASISIAQFDKPKYVLYRCIVFKYKHIALYTIKQIVRRVIDLVPSGLKECMLDAYRRKINKL